MPIIHLMFAPLILQLEQLASRFAVGGVRRAKCKRGDRASPLIAPYLPPFYIPSGTQTPLLRFFEVKKSIFI